MKRKHLIDVTEIFRLLNEEKKYRIIKLAFYCSIFIIVIYRYASRWLLFAFQVHLKPLCILKLEQLCAFTLLDDNKSHAVDHTGKLSNAV